MKIYFARHGETDWNCLKRIQGTTDIELNENGIRQAAELAESLKNDSVTISKIYTSKQKRAMKTGQIVAETLELPMVTIDGLQEMNLGLWEGNTWTQASERYPEEYQRWFESRRYTNTPGGESYQEVVERLFQTLDIILEQEKEDDILVVTHGAVILTLLALLKDVPFEKMSEVFKVPNATAICFEREELLKGKEKL